MVKCENEASVGGVLVGEDARMRKYSKCWNARMFECICF